MNKTTMTRRGFLSGSAAAFGFGAFGGWRGVLTAAAAQIPNMPPDLTIGIISDIHIQYSRKGANESFHGADVFRKTLEWFRDNGVDAVTVSGDLADHGLLCELEEIARIWYSVFPGGKAPDGRKVERLFVYGNHDFEGYKYGGFAKKLYGENYAPHIIRSDLGAAWRRAFDEDYSDVWRKDVKGYTFVGAHWTADRCRGKEEQGVPLGAEWLKANARSLDPSKPFFYLQHPPAKNTCHGPWLWGHDDGRLVEALAGVPNAVVMTGHSHAPINSECAIWQGAFTSIDVGSLKYTGLELGGTGDIGRENDKNPGAARAEDPWRIMGRLDTGDGHQGMIARVYGGKIVFERRDFGNMELLGPDWVVPVPVKEPAPFAFAPRAAASRAPEFASGAALSVRMATGRNRGGGNVKSVNQPVLEVTIPSASAAGRIFDYALELTDESGTKDERFVLAEGMHRSPKNKRALSPTVCRLAVRRLKVSGQVRIKVTPRNSFGKSGASIETSFAVPVEQENKAEGGAA